MWGLLAWLVLLAATVVLASVAFHFDVDQLPAAFQALSPTQQVAAILIALVALALTASTLWQSWRLTREAQQARAVQGGILGQKRAPRSQPARKRISTPRSPIFRPRSEDALSAIHKQLAESEARLSLQRGRNEAVDMKERLEEVRRRQQALREQIGEVAEKRRAIEPVFEELKDRQRQLARSLDKIETDDNNNNFIDALKEFDQKTAPLQARHQALQDAFALLTRLKEAVATSQSELARLQAPDGGVKALLGEVQISRDHLVKAIEALETTGEGEALTARVAVLDSGRKTPNCKSRGSRRRLPFSIPSAATWPIQEASGRSRRRLCRSRNRRGRQEPERPSR